MLNLTSTLRQLSCVALATCLLAACGDSKDKKNTDAATSNPVAQNVPTYRVATLAAFPPFVQRDEKSNPIGFDMDLLNAIGELQGFKLSYEIKMWKGILEGLESNQHDIVAAGVVVTPERQKLYDFSETYMDTRWALVLKDRSNEKIPPFQSFDEAVRNSKVFTTEYGAAGEATLEKIVQANNAKMIDSGTPYLEIANVLSGKADAAYDNSRVLEYYVFTRSQDPATKMYSLIDPNSSTSYFSFAVKKGNADLQNKLNAGLQQLKANGQYQQIKEKWFGKDSK